MSGLLSFKALEWLESVGYSSKNHQDRMILVEAAKIAYPNNEDKIDDDDL